MTDPVESFGVKGKARWVWRYFRGRRVTVIDLGATQVSCGVFVEAERGRWQIERVAVERWENAAVTTPERWREEISRAIPAVAARVGARGDVSVILPPHLVLMKTVKTPAIAGAKRERVVRFEAMQAIPQPLEDVVWDYAMMAEDAAELELMLMSAKADVVTDVCAEVEKAGLSVARVIPPAVALRCGVPACEGAEAGRCELVVAIGGRCTQLGWVEGERYHGRTLALGGQMVTRMMAEELGVSFAEAEKVKVEGGKQGSAMSDGAVVAGAIQRATEWFGGRLRAEIVRTMLDLERGRWMPRATVVRLTGGGAELETLSEVLAEMLRLPVERVAANAAARGNGWEGERSALERNASVGRGWVELAGAAKVAGGGLRGRVPDLLPPAHRARREFRRRQPRLIVAALLVMAGMVMPIWHFDRLAKAAEQRRSRLEAELEPVRWRAVENAERSEELGRVREETDSLRRLVEAKSSWNDLLAGLQDELRGIDDVWLDRLAVVDGRDNAEREESVARTIRIGVSGRLLDRAGGSGASDVNERAARLLAALSRSPWVMAVQDERFEQTQPGVLRFDCTLVIDGEKIL